MTAPADTAQSIRAALEPFVRPREEAAHIRRVLKAHLAASLKSDDDAIDGSLALVDIAWDTVALPEARGLQRNYLRALQANLEARRAFEQRAAATAAVADTESSTGLEAAPLASSGKDILQGHLTTVKLGRKRDRLQLVNRYLDALGERPVAVAAGEDYLHPEFIYGDATRTLPSVPKAVVDGLAEDETERAAAAVAAGSGNGEAGAAANTAQTTAAAGLEDLVAQLEKSVLRAQLALRQEEKRLAVAKERPNRRTATTAATQPNAATKLQALGVARDELIAWMEKELGNAGSEEQRRDESEDDDEEAAESSRLLRQSLLNGDDVVGGVGGIGGGQRKAQLDDKLDEIRNKYDCYVEARRGLVAMVGAMAAGDEGTAKTTTTPKNPLFANMPQLSRASGGEKATGEAAVTPTATTATPDTAATAGPDKAVALSHLLMAPYLERLLAVAHNQRADIAHKAHYNVLLAKRLKDTCQMLDHLADESQLLPRYGGKNGGASGHGGGGVGGVSGAGVGGGGGGAALLRKKGMLAPASGGGAAGTSSDRASQRVAAWTYAADSAKIATFEAVFEQVEDGQVALEQATQALAEAELLLGRTPEGAKEAGSESQKASSKQKGGDIWAALDGELGLLNSHSRRS